MIEQQEKYEELILRKYQDMNEKYLEETNYLDISDEEEKKDVWDNRPFKDVISSKVYYELTYQSNKKKIEEIDKDIGLLINPGKKEKEIEEKLSLIKIGIEWYRGSSENKGLDLLSNSIKTQLKIFQSQGNLQKDKFVNSQMSILFNNEYITFESIISGIQSILKGLKTSCLEEDKSNIDEMALNLNKVNLNKDNIHKLLVLSIIVDKAIEDKDQIERLLEFEGNVAIFKKGKVYGFTKMGLRCHNLLFEKDGEYLKIDQVLGE